VLNIIRDKHLESEIFSLIGFYESANSCIQAKICDREAIKTYFCLDARSFYHLHFRFIAHLRNKRNDNSFGKVFAVMANLPVKRDAEQAALPLAPRSSLLRYELS